MSQQRSKLGRRGFLGLSATAVAGVSAGVAIGLARSKADARWEVDKGGPDLTNTVWIRHVGGSARRAAVELVVTTPRERLTYELGQLTLQPGVNTVQVPLIYPYEGMVEGDYSYELRVGADLKTARPSTYSVREIAWFG